MFVFFRDDLDAYTSLVVADAVKEKDARIAELEETLRIIQSDYDEDEIKEHLISEYSAPRDDVNKYRILIAYESVGSWGCDSSSYFLMQDIETEKYFEFSGGHCSCYGFEDQYSPQEADLLYLQSDKFHFSTGGYDDNSDSNLQKAKDCIMNIGKVQVPDEVNKDWGIY